MPVVKTRKTWTKTKNTKKIMVGKWIFRATGAG